VPVVLTPVTQNDVDVTFVYVTERVFVPSVVPKPLQSGVDDADGIGDADENVVDDGSVPFCCRSATTAVFAFATSDWVDDSVALARVLT
jgi:hypothetical protein